MSEELYFDNELRKCLNAAGLSDCGENDAWNYWYQRVHKAHDQAVDRVTEAQRAENAKLREQIHWLKKGDILHVLTDQEYIDQCERERLMQVSIDALDKENAKLREDLEFERSENGWAREFLNRMGQKCGTKDCPSLVAYVTKLEAENTKLSELVDYMTPIAWYGASERERDRMRELGVDE